jgi:hypothetical protein
MDQALIQRAFAAYLQSDGLAEQPTSKSSVEIVGDLRYVVLRNEQRRVLAVYRVRRSGLLRRMRRWPLTVASDTGSERARELIATDAAIFGGGA